MGAVSFFQNSRIEPKKRWQKSDGLAEKPGTWRKICTNLKESWTQTEQHSSYRRQCGVFLHHHPLNHRKRVCVDSRASMHMPSKRDLNAAELEAVRKCSNPTKVITANGEVQTNEDATVSVKDLDLLVTVQLLQDSPPVPSLGQLFEDHGYSYEWTGWSKTTLNERKKVPCNAENCVPVGVPGLSSGSSSSSTAPPPTSSSQDSTRDEST